MNNIILNDNEKEEEKKLLIKLKKELDYLSDYNNFKKINNLSKNSWQNRKDIVL